MRGDGMVMPLDDDADTTAFAEPYDISAFHRLHLQDSGNRLSYYAGAARRGLRYQVLPHYWGNPPAWRLKYRSVVGTRTLPDFACLGAIKSGTSDLSTYLFQHPSIVPPLSKEIFSDKPNSWRAHYPTVAEMDRVRRETGNASTGYFTPWMHHHPLMDNYRATCPDAKIILMLRNPVERAYSHYKWDLFLGGKAQSELPYYTTYANYVDMSLDHFPGMPYPSPSGFPLLQTGIYAKSTAKWIDRFGRDRVLVVKAEDFFSDTVATVCGIHEFLGLPPTPPVVHKAVNQNPLKAPPHDSEARGRLVEFYRPFNDQLYEVLGRDLGWS
ncbi:MAG: sulfotransferase domain-containing protein [Rhodococcus sp. (in: high G+C Gram-positive bacteria)]